MFEIALKNSTAFGLPGSRGTVMSLLNIKAKYLTNLPVKMLVSIDWFPADVARLSLTLWACHLIALRLCQFIQLRTDIRQ